MESFRGTSLEPSFCEAPEIQIGISLCGRKLEAVKAKWRNNVREKGWQGFSWGRSSQKSKHGVLIGKFRDREKRGWSRLGWRRSHFSFGSSMSCLMRFAFPWTLQNHFTLTRSRVCPLESREWLRILVDMFLQWCPYRRFQWLLQCSRNRHKVSQGFVTSSHIMHWEKSWNEACCQSEGEFASPGEIFHIPDSLPHHLTGKTGAKTKRDRTTPWPGSPSCALPLTPCLNLYFMLGPLKKLGRDSGWGRSTDLFVPFPNVTTLNKSPLPPTFYYYLFV